MLLFPFVQIVLSPPPPTFRFLEAGDEARREVCPCGGSKSGFVFSLATVIICLVKVSFLIVIQVKHVLCAVIHMVCRVTHCLTNPLDWTASLLSSTSVSRLLTSAYGIQVSLVLPANLSNLILILSIKSRR